MTFPGNENVFRKGYSWHFVRRGAQQTEHGVAGLIVARLSALFPLAGYWTRWRGPRRSIAMVINGLLAVERFRKLARKFEHATDLHCLCKFVGDESPWPLRPVVGA